MNRFRNLRAVATCASLCMVLAAAWAFAEDAPKGDAAHDAMMAEMMKYAAPGPQHAMLKPMVGTWKTVIKSWTGAPEPTVSYGTMKNELMLGGRYLESNYKGTYMGSPFEGFGLTGYDNKKREMIALWLDNMSTGWMVQNGTISADGKEITGKGTVDGPDGKPMDVRSVTRIESPNKHVYTMYGQANGQEAPLMEITYTRK